MQWKNFYRFDLVALLLIVILVISGCSGRATELAAEPSPVPTLNPTVAATEAPSTPEPVVDSSVLYHDDFTNPASGWTEEKFDNYFIGYHEPEYYHVEITSPNYKTAVFVPGKQDFGDVTIEVKAFTASSRTAETGDYNFGIAFRRSGDQYYAFTISQRTKQWYVLKSTPTELKILDQGSDETINDADVDDTLRVDAEGPNFFFRINDRLVSQITDSDYATGEIGFYVQTIDAEHVHIHYNELTISKLQVSPSQASALGALYHDDFTNPASGWAEKKFDNYFIGYHEPEYYHVEITSPNYKTTVFVPGKQDYGDVTIEVKAFTASSRTAEAGDFDFGIAFRRSGDQYYAFAISQRAKQWYVLKSTPTELETLTLGTYNDIHDPDAVDVIRVDAEGSNFSFRINDQLVSQVTDSDYASGEVGFFVQTFDATHVHIHYDELTIKNVELSLSCDVKAQAMNVRSGPGTEYSSSTFLSVGETINPVGRNADGDWLLISLDENNNQNWIFYSPGYLLCNGAVDALPVIQP